MLIRLEYFKIFPHDKAGVSHGFDLILYGKLATEDESKVTATQPLALARVPASGVLEATPPDPYEHYDLLRYECPLVFEACLPAVYEVVDSGKEAERQSLFLVYLCKDFMSKQWNAYARALKNVDAYCQGKRQFCLQCYRY